MSITIPATARYPVSVVGSGPMGATVANGVITFNWNMAALQNFSGDMSGFYLPVYNPATQTHGKATLNQLLAYVTSSSFGTLTGQVIKSVKAYFNLLPGASWSTFVTNYVGDISSTDGVYESIFCQAIAPENGVFWTTLVAYLEAIGRTTLQATADVTTIWANAPSQPL